MNTNPVIASNTINVQNDSKIPVFVTFTESGVPLSADATAAEENMSMKVDYLDMEGKPLDVYSLNQGTGFMMVVTVTNNTMRRIENFALTQMVPSGWEIQNTRLV